MAYRSTVENTKGYGYCVISMTDLVKDYCIKRYENTCQTVGGEIYELLPKIL
jgi:hypothetical protein